MYRAEPLYPALAQEKTTRLFLGNFDGFSSMAFPVKRRPFICLGEVMKNTFIFIILILMIFTSGAFATTNCQQTFTLLGRTKGSTPTFFIVQDLSGECQSSKLLELALLPGGIKKIEIEFNEYNSSKWFQDRFSLFRAEPFIQLERTEDVWKHPYSRWKIKNPESDQKLKTKLDKESVIEAVAWNRKNEKKGIQIPVFDGVKTEFIYFLPSGLYVDYEIDKVFFFEKTGFIFVFTTQKLKSPGLDTMHGFLVFKIIK